MERGSKADQIMTSVFMVLAIIALLCLLFVSNRTYFYSIASVALVMRIVQYVLRFFK